MSPSTIPMLNPLQPAHRPRACQEGMGLEPPRWPGGPGICPVANLPYFATRAELKAFQAKNASTDIETWKCAACGGFHFWGKVPAPAGGSSGTSRRQDVPEHVLRLLAETRAADEDASEVRTPGGMAFHSGVGIC